MEVRLHRVCLLGNTEPRTNSSQRARIRVRLSTDTELDLVFGKAADVGTSALALEVAPKRSS